MKRGVIIYTLLAGSLTIGGNWARAEAGDKPAPCKEFHGRGEKGVEDFGPLPIMAKVLRLSEDQQEKIRDIFKVGHHEHMALMEKMKENRRLLREKNNEVKFDEAGVLALAGKQGQLVANMIVAKEITRNRILAVLTPEQRDLHDRIQPLLERGPIPPPPCCDEKFSPFAGMVIAHRQHFRDEEIPPHMEPRQFDRLPFLDED